MPKFRFIYNTLIKVMYIFGAGHHKMSPVGPEIKKQRPKKNPKQRGVLLDILHIRLSFLKKRGRLWNSVRPI